MTLSTPLPTPRRRLRGALALGLALGLGAAPAVMLPAAASAQTTQTAPAAGEVDDKALKAFASAAVELRGIAQAMDAQMSEAEDDAAQEKMRTAATRDMVEAVEAEGLSVDDYNGIAARAQQDVELARRITAEMETIQTN